MPELTAVRRLAVALVPLVASVMATTASAAEGRQRMVVVIVAGDDQTLADNLTEVAISKLAESGDYKLIGFRELRGRLAEIPGDRTWSACVAAPACLDRLLLGADASAAVVGVVGQDEHGFRLRLSLEAAGKAGQAAPHDRTTPADVGLLIDAVQQGVIDLLAPAPPPPVVAPAPDSKKAVPAVAVSEKEKPRPPVLLATPATTPRPPPYVPYAGYVATVLAGMALSGAVVAGELAIANPAGATRAEVQADLDRRHGYATTANRLLVLGAGMAVIAVGAFIWNSRAGGSHPAPRVGPP